MPKSQKRNTPKDRRRRRRRALSVVTFTLSTLGLAWFFELQATTTIMFVRHADTDAAMAAGGDPPLNARGLARADLLANFLEDVDVIAGVDAIYVSEFKRTQQTAAPIAARLGVDVQIADQRDVVGFMKNVLHLNKGDIVLVVSHSDLIGPLVDELHGSKNIPPMGPDDFDDLYVVTIPWFGKVKTLRFPYATGWEMRATQTTALSDATD